MTKFIQSYLVNFVALNLKMEQEAMEIWPYVEFHKVRNIPFNS